MGGVLYSSRKADGCGAVFCFVISLILGTNFSTTRRHRLNYTRLLF